MTIRTGMALSMNGLTQRLFSAGYQRRFQVEGPGQFAVRGGIVDLYAPDMPKPCRIEFWGDEVDNCLLYTSSCRPQTGRRLRPSKH